MNVQCANCQVIIAADREDFGSAMQCGQCGSVVQIPTEYASEGVLIGRDYILGELLGKGGAGSVHLAYQISLDREVAIKLLHAQFAQDQHEIQGFVREARTAAKLNHPNIVRALAVGSESTADGPLYYIAMELVRGDSVMAELQRSYSLPYRDALRVAREAAKGLAFAWDSRQLLHRDVKPDNLMICDDGNVKLADLGLAMPASELDLESDDIDGTPQYICPEYLLGEPMDVRSDVYSLGATLYHMITGQFVFTGDPHEILYAHVNVAAVPPQQLDPYLPDDANAIVCKMLEKDPADRYSHPNEVVEALTAVIDRLDGKDKKKIKSPKADTADAPKARKIKKMRQRRGRSANAFATETKPNHTHTGEMAAVTESQTSIQPATARGQQQDNRIRMVIFGLGGLAAMLFIGLALALSGGDKDHAPANSKAGTRGAVPTVAQSTEPTAEPVEKAPKPTRMAKDFVPDPDKKYYIDCPAIGSRISGSGPGGNAYGETYQMPQAVDQSATGSEVEWRFVPNGDRWQVQLAVGGNHSRLWAVKVLGGIVMANTDRAGAWTQFAVTQAGDGKCYLTVPDGPPGFQRLGLFDDGNVKCGPSNSTSPNFQLLITEVGAPSPAR